MKRTRKLLIANLLVILIGCTAVLAGTLFLTGDSELATGDKNILVCAIDESEKRPGMGACDMCFIIHINNGKLVNYTSVYPHGMTHPNASEPEEAQEQGAGSKLLLHDSFWNKDNEKSCQYAKEIVENNLSTKIDAVVAINSEAVDAVIKSAEPLEVNGKQLNVSGIDIIRENQYEGGDTRGDAVLSLVQGLSQAANDGAKKTSMIEAAVDQYNKGNIVMYPQGSFMELLATKGVGSLFN